MKEYRVELRFEKQANFTTDSSGRLGPVGALLRVGTKIYSCLIQPVQTGPVKPGERRDFFLAVMSDAVDLKKSSRRQRMYIDRPVGTNTEALAEIVRLI